MIEVHAFTFWGICAVAAIGLFKSAVEMLIKEPPKDWTQSTYKEPGEAPEGFRWVLVKDE